MERLILKGCVLREKRGKGAVKKLRKAGFVPAIVYSKNFNLPISISQQALKELKMIHFSESILIEMKIENYKENELTVLIKDVQYHPITDEVLHIDFFRVSLGEKIRTKVPIVLKGEAKGVKSGGILEQMLWEIEVEAYPADIPDKIEIDISTLDLEDSIHVSDLEISSAIKILEPKDTTIVTIAAPQKEEEPGEEEEVAPEVIKEKKEE